MMSTIYKKFLFTCLLVATVFLAFSQSNENISNYQQVNTYTNPVLPGDHPDPTMIKVGDDYYHCGSSFHFTPYLPIYHSKDMVHWKIISRVVPPTVTKVTDRPSAGIWEGAITYFYGSFWIYYSVNSQQHFSKATTPYGPWSEPVAVKGNPVTGLLGYDDAIFVDDDGKPYLIIKNGQKTNRLQALGRDGQLTDTVINLDWINAKLQYSWAEGPVMCKRNGFYYYFPAGDVTGGQYVLRAKKLTSDSTYWERLGDFFKPVTDTKVGFRRPNHISAPFQIADGTWWTIGQSYERYGSDDWSGLGRQTSLYPVMWEGARPWGMAPTTLPITKPNLPQSGILWRSVGSDDFEKETLDLQWHFLTKKAAASYSLSARKGWIRLLPDTNRTHLVQKETDHFYTAVTKVDVDATDATTKAGIYLTNGDQKVSATLYSGYDNGKKIVFKLGNDLRSVDNTVGNIIWLKIERNEHNLMAWYSADGNTWVSLGNAISAVNLDKTQPNYNSWVGTSVGVFAEGKPADFDFFTAKDGFTPMVAGGYSNYYGVKKTTTGTDVLVTNTSTYGGWFMISGVELSKKSPSAIEITTAATAAGKLEIWLDDLKAGKLIATIPVSATGENNWKAFSKAVKNITGHHDVFVKYPTNSEGKITIKSIRFLK